jgi:hypothetical protein
MNVMAQASKTFRIFVSSTFNDLKEERNTLQNYVFPRLRELCMQHGCRFQAIDLRWGASEEATCDQHKMMVSDGGGKVLSLISGSRLPRPATRRASNA